FAHADETRKTRARRMYILVQVFVDMKYKDSTVNTDDQIVGLLIALLFAGQHTSSITSTWTSLLASR
ncbi:unnamed protein product, partial [Scytosiphon promiscuus]